MYLLMSDITFFQLMYNLFLKFCNSRNPTLRYSLCLSTQEKAFMELRKEKTLEEMRKLLGVEDGPLNIDEVWEHIILL